MVIDLPEDDRQVILLALAHLAVERPGWDHSLTGGARRLAGEVLFTECRASRRQGCTASVPDPPGGTRAPHAREGNHG